MHHTVIARLLIVFALLSNLGWMADLHADENLTFRSATSTGTALEDCPSGLNCQHSCHATAHLLAMPSNPFALNPNAAACPGFIFEARIASFIPEPFDQPPRI